MFKFENGNLIKGAYVKINGVEYEVNMPQYYGATPMSAENMNKAQRELKEETKKELQTQINSLASGSPLVASSVSEMTDTNRVYVNTSDGHWYTYNGTVWVDGGVYQGIEVEENSINEFKTNFYKQSINKLFVKSITGKGLTVSYDNDTGMTSIKGSAKDLPLNLIIGEFKIEKEENFTFFAKVNKGSKPSIYIYDKADSKNYIRAIPANSNFLQFNLPAGNYTYNAWYETGTVVDTEFYMQLISTARIQENKISNNYYKAGFKNINDNSLNQDEYPIMDLLKANLLSSDNSYVGTLDLSNKTLTLNSNIFITFNKYYNTGINKIVTDNNNLSNVNRDITAPINLIPDGGKSGLCAVVMNYKGEVSVKNYTNFSDLDNYFILLLYFYNLTTSRIISYNGMGNNFRIIGRTEFSNLTYNAIGDSLTFGFTGFDSEGNQIRLDTPFPSFVKNNLNLAQIYNNGLTGTTVANDTAVQGTFLPMSNDERMATYENADIISVMGGTNDFSKNVNLGTIDTEDETTFYGGYKKLINYLITNNPTSLIFLITPPCTQNVPTAINDKGYSRNDITKAIKELGNYYGIPVLDMNSIGRLGYINKSSWTNDGTHFTQDYVSKIFGPIVVKFIDDNLKSVGEV